MSDRRKTVLVVDDDEGTRARLEAVLRRDYRVLRASTGEACLQIVEKDDVDLMLLDVRLPGISGLEVLRIVKENCPHIEVIVVSALTELDAAIEAMRHGAYHYISKDADADNVGRVMANASERQDLSRHVMRLTAEAAERNDRNFIVGPSRATRDVVDLVRKVGKLSATCLILGESGTGKELLARMIYREAGNPSLPFVAVNLAAIPKELVESTLFGHEKCAFTGAVRQQLGKFELASGGTLFLDEIGDLRYDLQAKLLRAIQEGEIERVGGEPPDQDRLPPDRGHQRRSRQGRQGREIPGGSLLPPQRDPHEDARAAGSDRGPARPRALLSQPLQREVPEEHPGHRRLDAPDPRWLLVARQHP